MEKKEFQNKTDLIYSSKRLRGRKPSINGMALTFGEFKDGNIKTRRAIFRKLIKYLNQNSK
jgi:hypothetical protein